MMKRTLFAAAATALALSSLAGTAWAHPAYKDSDPKAGATVATPPTEVWVEFTEMIEEGYVHVYDPCGERVDHGESEPNLTNDRLTVGTHGDKAGTYLVHWEVLGSDSHITRGDFSFTSSGGDACPGEEEEEPENPRSPTDDRDEDDQATTTDDDRTDRTDAEDRSSRSGGERRDRDKSGNQNHHRAEKDRVAGTRVLAQDEAPDTEETSATGIWDGIPMGDFLVALGVAALIGAAGGRIYAGILGPRR